MRGDGWIPAHGGGTSRTVSSRFRASLNCGFSSFGCTGSGVHRSEIARRSLSLMGQHTLQTMQ
jgi:hypothetical protein